MRFKTCGCQRQYQKCIITGFRFNNYQDSFNGDLYFCKHCQAVNIFGINPHYSPAKDGLSSFEGVIHSDDTFGKYLQSERFGETTLNDKDVAYLAKWDSDVYKAALPDNTDESPTNPDDPAPM